MSSYPSGNDAAAAPTAAPSIATAAAAGGAQPTTVKGSILVYHTSIVILALIALLFLPRIPRILARLSRFSQWSRGHIFRNVPNGAPRIVHITHEKAGISADAGLSDESHTYYQHATHIQRVDEKGFQAPIDYPPHVSSYPAVFRGLSSELSRRVLPGVSISQVVCVSVYLGAWSYATLYKANPFSEPKRAGWVGTAQLQFIFAFAAKNNVLGSFLGLGYEKLNFMHRAAGMIMVAAINVHSLGYIYKWLIKEVFREHIAEPSNYWGLIGLISVDICYFFSTEGWRKRAYNIFIGSHVGGFSLLLAATWMHQEHTMPFVWAAIALYSFDSLCRWIKTRIHTAVLRPIPELGMTRVEIPQINAGWRAGQHVRIRVVSSGMGIIGWAETHPFTIASATNSPEGMILMIKKAGGWTNKLFEMAKMRGSAEGGFGRDVRVMVEGPYGGPGHTIPESSSVAVFVVGGSGITYAMSGINELIQRDLKGKSRVKIIELVWIVQDPAALVALVAQFSAMIQQSVYTPVRISVFYTRAIVGKFPFTKDFFHPRLSLSPGRPKIANILEGTISKALMSDPGNSQKGMMVAVCGPTALADDVVREVGKIDSKRRDQIGGIEVMEEVFGW